MKRFSFQELLLILAVFLVSCKSINTTSAGPNGRHLPFNNSVYLSIFHREEQSLLRNKLLKLIQDNQVKEPHEVKEALKVDKIDNGDEFKLADNSFKLAAVNLEEYNNLKSNAAEIIVSYKDHLDIYFVPTGIDSNMALSQLEVEADPGEVFFWVNPFDNFLFKDKVYYLLSVSQKG